VPTLFIIVAVPAESSGTRRRRIASAFVEIGSAWARRPVCFSSSA